MAGISICPEEGSNVVGKHGRYLVKNRIDGGGNGVVFAADVISGGESLPQKGGYVIKFLVINANDKNEGEKRIARFKKEIQKVLLFQNEVDNIIPIYDASIYCEGEQGFLWYLMPKAEKYNPRSFSVHQKLEHMLCLGNCIKQLHELGYAHRDIKPKNLLMFEGKVCLADFGLVWNSDDTALGYGANVTYYGAYNRLVNNKEPQYACPNNSRDLFTTNGSNTGNAKLTNPIGLLSADEYAFLGGAYSRDVSNNFLKIDYVWFLGSPYSYYVRDGAQMYVVRPGDGGLVMDDFHQNIGVRPVINLKPSALVTRGTGISTDPYIIKAN